MNKTWKCGTDEANSAISEKGKKIKGNRKASTFEEKDVKSKK